jgi:hypothetical protein
LGWWHSYTGKSYTGQITFRAQIDDDVIGSVGGNASAVATAVLYFRDRLFWIVEDNDTITGLNSATIRAWDTGDASPYGVDEGDSDLATNAARTIVVAAGAAGRYLKYFIPDTMTMPQVRFNGGLAATIGAADQQAVTIKNANGSTDVVGKVVRVPLPTDETTVEFVNV